MRVWRKVGLAVVVALVGLVAYGFLSLFGTWPVFRAGRVTEITDITFPASAVLVSGYDVRGGPSQIAFAKLRMPRRDLAAFQSQAKMSPFEALTPAQVDRVIAAEFGRQGWSLSGVRDLQQAWFSNGSFTRVLVDRDDLQTVTVYVYYDEP